MDAKTLKNAYKAAAVHIKDQEFKEAVKVCQVLIGLRNYLINSRSHNF